MGYLKRAVPLGLSLSLISFLSPPFPGPVSASKSSLSIVRHELFVEIDPERHALVAADRLTIEPAQAHGVRLSLAPTLDLDRVVLSPSSNSGNDAGRDVPLEIDHQAAGGSERSITLPEASVQKGTMTLMAYYHGVINDPPKEPRHLRFVTPSETAGHIGPEGLYLSSESQWYLDIPESLSEYRLRVALPAGWTAVTQGKVRSVGSCPRELCSRADFTVTEWEPIQPTEALTLVANRFGWVRTCFPRMRSWRTNIWMRLRAISRPMSRCSVPIRLTRSQSWRTSSRAVSACPPLRCWGAL
jgi:hypothetical protein